MDMPVYTTSPVSSATIHCWISKLPPKCQSISDVTKTFYIFILHCTSKIKVLEVLRGSQLAHNSFYFAVLLQRSLPMKFDSEI